MRFEPELTQGRLLRRYKRFLADVELADGRVVTAHCANPGSMLSVCPEGAAVWLSPATNPKAKLDWKWELVDIDGALVGINTARANALVEEAIVEGRVPELAGYRSLRREVRYGAENSRIDLLLEGPGCCFVEVKNVTMRRGRDAEFPDSVTARGAKHLRELAQMAAQGRRAVMFYLVHRGDCAQFKVAGDIDPAYDAGLRAALDAGVEALVYACDVSPAGVRVDRALEMRL